MRTIEAQQCTKCKEEFPLDQFYKNKARKNGLDCYCKPCRNVLNKSSHKFKEYSQKASKNWYDSNTQSILERRKDNYDPYKDRSYKISRRYNLTIEEYEDLFIQQDYVCKICKKPETRTLKGITLRLVVDHNHITGAVRGLLCHKCNAAIGFFDDNSELIRNAAQYVKGV